MREEEGGEEEEELRNEGNNKASARPRDQVLQGSQAACERSTCHVEREGTHRANSHRSQTGFMHGTVNLSRMVGVTLIKKMHVRLACGEV